MSIQILLFLSIIGLIVGIWVVAIHVHNCRVEIDNWFEDHNPVSHMMRQFNVTTSNSELKSQSLKLVADALLRHPNIRIICTGVYLNPNRKYVVAVLGFEGNVSTEDIDWLKAPGVVCELLNKAYQIMHKTHPSPLPRFLHTDLITDPDYKYIPELQ
jgi:hypothetical protein